MRPNPDEGEKRTNEIGTIIPVLETLSRWPRVMAPRGIESARNGGDQPALALSRRWRPGERAARTPKLRARRSIMRSNPVESM